MTVREFIARGRQSLSRIYPQREAEAVLTRLCEELLDRRSYEWALDPSLEIPEGLARDFSSAMDRLGRGEPLQYVLGFADFCGRRFTVDPSVLIPRPETEQLCCIILDRVASDSSFRQFPASSAAPDSSLRRFPSAPDDFPGGFSIAEAGPARRWDGLRILDLCTGSGCIAWTLALSLPGSRVLGADISSSALHTARTQPLFGEASRLGANPPEFIEYDILAGPDGFPGGEFDVIVSNPPYVRESERKDMAVNVLNYEPGLALFVPDDDPLLFYRSVTAFSVKRLRPPGIAAIEINEAFGGPVRAILEEAGFGRIDAVRDFRAKFRFFTFSKRS